MSISYDETRQIIVEAELRRFSDEDLLLELRRRKRFARIQYSCVIPRHITKAEGVNAPDEYVFPRMFSELGRELARSYLGGQLPLPGMKREHENVTPFSYNEHFVIPMNIVVEKK